MRLAVLGAMVAGLWWLITSGCFALCENDLATEHRSPDGAAKVVVFRRSCGATTGFSTQASLLGIDEELPSEAGNIFVADRDHGAAPAAPSGGPRLDVTWDNARAVTLAHDRRARVFKAEAAHSGVSIRYAELP